MPSPEIQEWVNLVIKSTDSGDIKWKILNPTSYAWEIPAPKNARVTLQRVERMVATQTAPGRILQRKDVQYLLQVIDIGKQPSPVVTLNGAEDPELNAQLEKLFGMVSSAATRENIDFLKSLLPSGPGGSHTG
jgi:hypothetical protein